MENKIYRIREALKNVMLEIDGAIDGYAWGEETTGNSDFRSNIKDLQNVYNKLEIIYNKTETGVKL